MRMIASRPTDMECVNDVYYPMGLPKEDDPKETFWFDNYTDKDFRRFHICYTKKQVEDALKGREMVAFAPFIPFMQTLLPK